MESLLYNGGMLGLTMDFGSTEQYIIGTTTGPLTPTYVGGMTDSRPGIASTSIRTLDSALTDSLQEGDLLVLMFATGATANYSATIFPPTSGGVAYTTIYSGYANDTEDTLLFIGYMFMGATIPTEVTLPNGSGNAADALAIAIHAWRNIDQTTPLDVSAVTNVTVNTVIPNTPSITPVTDNAVIIAMAAGAHTRGIDVYSSSLLDNFISIGENDTNDVTVGMGSHLWSSGDGAYDPDDFSFSDIDSTAFSNIATTIALRPATGDIPIYGNYKNSGIWSLDAAYYSTLGSTMLYSYSTYSYSSNDVSISVPVPLSDIQAGDYIFGYGSAASGGANPFLLPSGYTQLLYEENAQTNMLFYKIADGSETEIVLPAAGNPDQCVSVVVVRGITGFAVGTSTSSQTQDAASLSVSVSDTGNAGGTLFAFAATRDRASPYTSVWDESVTGMTTASSTNASDGTADYMGAIVWKQDGSSGSDSKTINMPTNAAGTDSMSAALLYVY